MTQWFDSTTGQPAASVTKKQRKRSLTDVLLWLILAGFTIAALTILAPLLQSGGRSPNTNGGYVGSISLDPTMAAVMETVAVSGGNQESLQLTQVALLQGIQPTATATPKPTRTPNPTPQVPDCDVADVGDLCRIPAMRETVVPKATQTPILGCTLVTPSTYGPTMCIKDAVNDGMGVD